MASCCVKLFDDACDGLAYARNILQAFLGDHLIQRETQRQQIIRRARRLLFGKDYLLAKRCAARIP